jgi:uncharacterized protein YrrD
MICTKSLKGQPIEALDGLIGHVDDLYFDDSAWKIRYVVVQTGNWLLGRKVLIVPEALAEGWHGESGVPVNLTKDEIRTSPDIGSAQPISRVDEHVLHDHYGWLPYWGGGVAPLPASNVISVLERRIEAPSTDTKRTDAHLRCAKDIIGYKLFANGGEAGQLEDLIIHEDDAQVRYLAVHLTKSRLTKTVLIHTCSISGFNVTKRILFSSRLCHEIEGSPEYEKAVR